MQHLGLHLLVQFVILQLQFILIEQLQFVVGQQLQFQQLRWRQQRVRRMREFILNADREPQCVPRSRPR